jgi:hypothetical protein
LKYIGLSCWRNKAKITPGWKMWVKLKRWKSLNNRYFLVFTIMGNVIILLSRAINFGRQCHFKIWLDCHKFKKIPCLIMPTSTKCQKIKTINVIQHDDRLWYFTTVLQWSIFDCVKEWPWRSKFFARDYQNPFDTRYVLLGNYTSKGPVATIKYNIW